MAALDRRLQAHQEAYGLLMKALASVHQPDVLHKMVIERDQCWKTSCLYLSAEARAALAEWGWRSQLFFAICIDTWACGGGWLSCLDVTTGRLWQARQSGETRTAWIGDFALEL